MQKRPSLKNVQNVLFPIHLPNIEQHGFPLRDGKMLGGALGVFRIKGMQLRSVFHHNDLAAIPIAAKDFG